MIEFTRLQQLINADVCQHIKWYNFDSVASTQKFLHQTILSKDTLEICIAKQQTQGVGQRNSLWVAPTNTGLWLSIALQPQQDMVWSLAIAFDLATVINQFKINLALKWPNDIIIENKKVAGILIENMPEKLIIGIGINIYNNALLPDTSTYLTKYQPKLNINCFAYSLIKKLIDRTMNISSQNIWCDYWNNNLYAKNQIIKFQHNQQVIIGTLVKVDVDGGLVIKTNSGVNKFYNGRLLCN